MQKPAAMEMITQAYPTWRGAGLLEALGDVIPHSFLDSCFEQLAGGEKVSSIGVCDAA